MKRTRFHIPLDGEPGLHPEDFLGLFAGLTIAA